MSTPRLQKVSGTDNVGEIGDIPVADNEDVDEDDYNTEKEEHMVVKVKSNPVSHELLPGKATRDWRSQLPS